ncbi:MAG: cytochrome b5 domain-containing protein [Polyangiaceae bacterium]
MGRPLHAGVAKTGVGQVSNSDPVGEARRVLESAEATNRERGHENAGFLSERLGFVPSRAPEPALPPPFAEWDSIAQRLPELMASLELRSEIARLPLLQADSVALPDPHLLRAAHVLAMLSHAHVYAEPGTPAQPPLVLAAPWASVCQRLGRPATAMSYIDLIVYNYRFVDASLGDPFRVDNLRLLTPVFDTREEHVFYLTQVEILAQSAPIVGAAVRAQEAVLVRDDGALELELWAIEGCLRELAQRSLVKIDPVRGRRTHVDPVLWAKSVAPFGVPIQPGVQGPSGTSSPLFGLLDAFVGRSRHESLLGIEIRGLRSMYPPLWREFLLAIERAPVLDYVERSAPSVRAAFAALLEAYSGSGGFLGRHRRKVYGYLEIAFKVGREMTIGGFGGVFAERTWNRVDSELDKARNERPSSEPSPRPSEVARAAVRPSRVVDASELILHNDRERGYWLAIDGEVLDVTAFIERHPGGSHTLEGHAGTDATLAYRRAHKDDALPRSLRKTLALGRLRTCAELGLLRGEPEQSPFVRYHEQCQKLAFLATEMENALRLDVRFFARSDESGARTYYELLRAAEGQARFFRSYLGELIGNSFESVLLAAAALDAVASDATRHALVALASSEAFARASRWPEALADALTSTRQGTAPSVDELSARCRELERRNALVLRQIKLELSELLGNLEKAGAASVASLTRVVEHAALYMADFASEAEG